jgi:hypothetical protein
MAWLCLFDKKCNKFGQVCTWIDSILTGMHWCELIIEIMIREKYLSNG